MTYVGRPTAANRFMMPLAGCASGSSAWNLILTYRLSAEVTVGSSSVVLSMVRQFLHQVAHMSMSTGACSREAVARPSVNELCQPAFSFSSTLVVTADASTHRLANNSYDW